MLGLEDADVVRTSGRTAGVAWACAQDRAPVRQRDPLTIEQLRFFQEGAVFGTSRCPTCTGLTRSATAVLQGAAEKARGPRRVRLYTRGPRAGQVLIGRRGPRSGQVAWATRAGLLHSMWAAIVISLARPQSGFLAVLPWLSVKAETFNTSTTHSDFA